jgi:hypothetical protein
MTRAMVVVVVVGVLLGLAAHALWGPRVGVGAGSLVIVVGAVALVLRRNQGDLRELEEGRLREEVEQVLGDEDE